MDLRGKTSVVFGGARGIGQACVERLLKEGAKVCIGDVLTDTGVSAEAALLKRYPDQVMFVKCDITADSDLQNIFEKTKEKFGTPEIIINTAAIVDEFNWQKTVSVNYSGTIAVTYKAFEFMSKEKGGSGGVVVHTSSLNGLTPSKYHPVYVSTKHAIVGFVKSLGLPDHVARTGVRVNAICPGTVNTHLLAEVRTYFMDDMAGDVEENFHYVPVESCVEGALRLIKDESLSGELMICAKSGIFLHDKAREEFYQALII